MCGKAMPQDMNAGMFGNHGLPQGLFNARCGVELEQYHRTVWPVSGQLRIAVEGKTYYHPADCAALG